MKIRDDLLETGRLLIRARDTGSYRANGYATFDDYCSDVICRRAPSLITPQLGARDLAGLMMSAAESEAAHAG